jgi:hypothetical protein
MMGKDWASRPFSSLGFCVISAILWLPNAMMAFALSWEKTLRQMSIRQLWYHGSALFGDPLKSRI